MNTTVKMNRQVHQSLRDIAREHGVQLGDVMRAACLALNHLTEADLVALLRQAVATGADEARDQAIAAVRAARPAKGRAGPSKKRSS